MKTISLAIVCGSSIIGLAILAEKGSPLLGGFLLVTMFVSWIGVLIAKKD